MIPKTAKRRGRARLKRAAMGASCASILALTVCVGSLGNAQDAAPANDVPESHSVAEGDTLWGLSGRYFRSPYDWPRLWSYNPEITNPHWIYPGHVLRLREGAKGGYTVAVVQGEGGNGGVETGAGAEGAAPGTTLSAGFGRGFYAGGRSRLPQGTVQLGEQVYLDHDALDRAGIIVGSHEDHMLMSPSDEIYVRFDKGEAPVVGKELSVFVRLHRQEVNPVATRVRAYHSGGDVVRVLGAIKVKSYDEDKRMARAVVVEASDIIERGFEVTDTPMKLAQVQPKTNARTVDAKIVAATRPLGTLGQNQVVFIGAGSEQGVEVGNRFSVVRQGDTWRDELTLTEELSGAQRPMARTPRRSDYPVEVVGEARVIYVRPESCTALITDSLGELVIGDRVQMREGY